MRIRSGLGNNNENHQPEPHIIEHAHEAMMVDEPIMMVRIRALLAEQREEMR